MQQVLHCWVVQVWGHAYSKRLSSSVLLSEPSLLANTLHVSSTRGALSSSVRRGLGWRERGGD